MGLRRKIYQPLPFYKTFEETYYKGRCEQCDNVLIFDRTHLPSFVIERDSDFLLNTFTIQLIDIYDQSVLQVVTTAYSPKIVSYLDESSNLKDQILFNEPLINIVPCGFYRIKISDGTNVWYSETYKVIDIDLTKISNNKIEWRNDCDLNDVMFSEYPAFKFCLYLEDVSKICEPDYEFEKTVQKNNLGSETPKLQTMKKLYRLDTGFLPEYLIDSISVMRIHNEIKIFPLGEDVANYDYLIEDLETSDVSWDENGCLSTLELRFIRDMSIIKTGCCSTDKLICPDFVEVQYFGDALGVIFVIPVIGDKYYIETGNMCWFITNDFCDHIGEIATWDGVKWNYETPTYKFIETKTPPYMYAELIGGVYQKVLDMSVVNTGIGMGVLSGIVPINYYGKVDYSTDGGVTWNDLGTYTKVQLSAGINVSGAMVVSYRLQAINYNCAFGFVVFEHTFAGL